MRIYIITMEDPVYTVDFIKEIISAKHDEVIGLSIAKGGRLKISRKRSKLVYLMSLLLIMGPVFFIGNAVKTLKYKLRKKLSKSFKFIKPGDLAGYARKFNIPVDNINSPNNKDFLKRLKDLSPDIIINQSQFIIKEELLSIPKIGVLNRHNALLPRNRGRLTPFWVLYKNEKESGVSIHFVDKGLDSGGIVVQEKFNIHPGWKFKDIVRKNYELAGKSMIKAIDLLKDPEFKAIPNNDELATYNTVPTFKEALRYRLRLHKK